MKPVLIIKLGDTLPDLASSFGRKRRSLGEWQTHSPKW